MNEKRIFSYTLNHHSLQRGVAEERERAVSQWDRIFTYILHSQGTTTVLQWFNGKRNDGKFPLNIVPNVFNNCYRWIVCPGESSTLKKERKKERTTRHEVLDGFSKRGKTRRDFENRVRWNLIPLIKLKYKY